MHGVSYRSAQKIISFLTRPRCCRYRGLLKVPNKWAGWANFVKLFPYYLAFSELEGILELLK